MYNYFKQWLNNNSQALTGVGCINLPCNQEHMHKQRSTAQHSTAQHSTAQHSTAQHSTAIQ